MRTPKSNVDWSFSLETNICSIFLFLSVDYSKVRICSDWPCFFAFCWVKVVAVWMSTLMTPEELGNSEVACRTLINFTPTDVWRRKTCSCLHGSVTVLPLKPWSGLSMRHVCPYDRRPQLLSALWGRLDAVCAWTCLYVSEKEHFMASV